MAANRSGHFPAELSSESLRWIDLEDEGATYVYAAMPGTRKYFPGVGRLKTSLREVYGNDDNRVCWLERDDYGFRFKFDDDAEGSGEIYLREFRGGSDVLLIHDTQIKVIYLHLVLNALQPNRRRTSS